MKTFTKFFTIFCVVIISQTLSAQTKKKPVAKNLPAKEPITFLEKILDNNIDDAALLLDEEFSSFGINFNKVEDDVDYIYDENLKKTDTLYNHFKTLRTDKNFQIYLVADEQKKLTEFKISGYQITDSLTKKILQAIGIKKWNPVEIKGESSLYKKGKYFAKLISGNIFSCEAYLPVPIKSTENTDSLTIKSSFPEAVGFAQRILLNMGFTLLASKKQAVINDSKYNFISYSQDLIYNQRTEMNVSMDENRKITINISNPNAVVFGSIKNKLIDTSWNEKYTNSVSQLTFFRKNNLMAKLFSDGSFITLYAIPSSNDAETKLTYGDFLSLNDLNEIYDGFNYDDRLAYMNDHYLVDADYGNNTFVLQKKGYKLRYLFGGENDFKTNWGLKFLVDSDNEIVNNYYKNTIENLSLSSKDYSIDVKTHGFPNRTQFYDKTIFSANNASQNAKQNAQLLADQREEALQKQKEIIREQEKARKNAELTETLNKATNDLLKLFQK